MVRNGFLIILTQITRLFRDFYVLYLSKHKNVNNLIKHKVINELIETNLDYLVRFAAFRIGNLPDAEDVVHDSIVKFLETDVSKIKKKNLRMYLFRIVYNLCTDYYMTSHNSRIISDNYETVCDTDSRPADLDTAEIERINTLLDNLHQREAEVIRMNIVDELSFVEISQILSIPPSTAKSRFKSGMDKLKTLYLKNEQWP